MKRATLQHPKTIELAEASGMSRLEVLGLLTLLWDFTGQYAPDGGVGRYTNEAIAKACDIEPERADEVVGHLVRTGWLDEVEDQCVRLVVHDWEDHCEQWVRKRLTREKREFVRMKRISKPSGQNGYPKRLPSPTPTPTPSPAKKTPPTPPAGKLDAKPKRRKPPSPRVDQISIPPPLDTGRFRAAWDLWATHRDEIKKPLTPASVKMQLRQMEDMGHDRAIAAIEYTVGKGWQGLEEPGRSGSGRSASNHSGRNGATERRAEQRRGEFAEPVRPLPFLPIDDDTGTAKKGAG